ncbi:hypothetical protein [Roseibium sediminicola]|uniref:Uncharacterized protein n=1 Tax=Roseibium sediminicola TaxID=2933272 RepID=A0ABT0H0T3_9HYPH|nr:hypothetical protein [Roseibium sp. CAU 1639]MCK7615284.1 hypothetical protein [Roseibium sp. CAU 1639]
MDLANASPKQLRSLADDIAAKDDEKLADFVGSLEALLAHSVLDEGPFEDEIFVLGRNLSTFGVLRKVGAQRIGNALSRIGQDVLDVFFEGVQDDFAAEIQREIEISKSVAQTADLYSIENEAEPFVAYVENVLPGVESNWVVEPVKTLIFRTDGTAQVASSVGYLPRPKHVDTSAAAVWHVISDVQAKSENFVPIDVKAGDRVLLGKWSGAMVNIDGNDLLIVKEADFLGTTSTPTDLLKKS